MRPKSVLLPPPGQLSSCIVAAIVRDTRGVALSDADRFNHFPASPLVSVTSVIEGDLRQVPNDGGIDAVREAPPVPRRYVAPPQDKPLTSWSPGPMAAVTIGIFPEAWAKLARSKLECTVPEALEAAFRTLEADGDPMDCWVHFCATFTPSWQQARATGGLPDWTGSHRLADWSHTLLNRVALAGPGRSMRALERRLRRWSGQTRQSLQFYTAIETLHQLSVNAGDTPLAALASDAGYADQSHMGRAVRRATGFSPARLNRLIETKEAFWCYRLLGERF